MSANPPEAVYDLGGLQELSARPNQLGVVGWPVRHSISPAMHQAALSALSRTDDRFLDWTYSAFELPPDDLEEAITLFHEKGFRGVNLTVPHKVDVLPFIDEIASEARGMGAVNTVVFEGDRVLGYNTDGYGLEKALEEAFGISLEGREFLILGAGGASRAAVAQCIASGANRVTIANRTIEKAVGIADRFRGSESSCILDAVTPDELGGLIRAGTIVINATSLGLKATDHLPLTVSDLPENCLFFDMIYNPSLTPFLEAGRDRGYPVSNGLGMLVHQGVKSLETWTGRPVDAAVMRAACAEALSTPS
ncbi:MAG: shikimate dehydrogenase [Verrucomicrobiota bacterium]